MIGVDIYGRNVRGWERSTKSTKIIWSKRGANLRVEKRRDGVFPGPPMKLPRARRACLPGGRAHKTHMNWKKETLHTGRGVPSSRKKERGDRPQKPHTKQPPQQKNRKTRRRFKHDEPPSVTRSCNLRETPRRFQVTGKHYEAICMGVRLVSMSGGLAVCLCGE